MTTPHVIASSSSSHPPQSGSSNGIVGNNYRVGKKIGEGSFGVVFEGLFYYSAPTSFAASGCYPPCQRASSSESSCGRRFHHNCFLRPFLSLSPSVTKVLSLIFRHEDNQQLAGGHQIRARTCSSMLAQTLNSFFRNQESQMRPS
jgi:hypothetical protein